MLAVLQVAAAKFEVEQHHKIPVQQYKVMLWRQVEAANMHSQDVHCCIPSAEQDSCASSAVSVYSTIGDEKAEG